MENRSTTDTTTGVCFTNFVLECIPRGTSDLDGRAKMDGMMLERLLDRLKHEKSTEEDTEGEVNRWWGTAY
jgi:hypothetical protein